VSIRYELKPLDEETVAAYVAHRLAIAGGSASVTFTTKAITVVHRLSGGIPRLINLICDRALLAGFSLRESRITPDMVRHAAKGLELAPIARPPMGWLAWRASLAAGGAVVLVGSAFAVGASTLLYERFGGDRLQASVSAPARSAVPVRASSSASPDVGPLSVVPERRLPSDATLTILAGSYPVSTSEAEMRAVTEWLEASGFRVYFVRVDLGSAGIWQRVLAGAYTDPDVATAEVARLNIAAPALQAQLVTSDRARGMGTGR
jgi:general secretion pathway protein A